MHIAVCLKQVPNTTELRLDPKTNSLLRDGVESVLNPLDEYPLETALRLRDSCGGTITAITMGPPQATAVLERAIAMGVDNTLLVCDRQFAGADTWATSRALAQTLASTGPYDLILCGKQAIDGDTGQVGPEIAGHLGIPQATNAAAVRFEDGHSLEITRLFDPGKAVIRLELPALITVVKEANEPRLPSLAGRLRAWRHVPRVLDAGALNLSSQESGLEGSPTQVLRVAGVQATRPHTCLAGSARMQGQQLVAKLCQHKLLSSQKFPARDSS
jgi:electron transfer flavoprotein beta subunit